MPNHDGAYFRPRRYSLRTPERDQFSDAKLVRQGIEVQRLERLPWPRKISGEYATVAELVGQRNNGAHRDTDLYMSPPGAYTIAPSWPAS